MSKKIVREVWEQAQVKSSGELVILLALAEHADDCGHAWPSLLRLMKYSRFSKRNVQRLLNSLSQRQVIRITIAGGPKGCNLYTLQDTLVSKRADDRPCTLHRCADDKTGAVQVTNRVAVQVSAPSPRSLDLNPDSDPEKRVRLLEFLGMPKDLDAWAASMNGHLPNSL